VRPGAEAKRSVSPPTLTVVTIGLPEQEPDNAYEGTRPFPTQNTYDAPSPHRQADDARHTDKHTRPTGQGQRRARGHRAGGQPCEEVRAQPGKSWPRGQAHRRPPNNGWPVTHHSLSGKIDEPPTADGRAPDGPLGARCSGGVRSSSPTSTAIQVKSTGVGQFRPRPECDPRGRLVHDGSGLAVSTPHTGQPLASTAKSPLLRSRTSGARLLPSKYQNKRPRHIERVVRHTDRLGQVGERFEAFILDRLGGSVARVRTLVAPSCWRAFVALLRLPDATRARGLAPCRLYARTSCGATSTRCAENVPLPDRRRQTDLPAARSSHEWPSCSKVLGAPRARRRDRLGTDTRVARAAAGTFLSIAAPEGLFARAAPSACAGGSPIRDPRTSRRRAARPRRGAVTNAVHVDRGRLAGVRRVEAAAGAGGQLVVRSAPAGSASYRGADQRRACGARGSKAVRFVPLVRGVRQCGTCRGVRLLQPQMRSDPDR